MRGNSMHAVEIAKRPEPEKMFVEAWRYEEKADFKKAFQCLYSAAQLGHPMSQVNLGNYYAEGRGVKKNSQKAAYWYRKAYRSGDCDGALNLAIDRRDDGNMRSAILWFKKAIAMNSGDAFVALARIYLSRKRRQSAIDLLRRALRLGNSDISEETKEQAKALLQNIANAKTGVELLASG